MISVLGQRQCAGAEAALQEGMGLVALDLHQLAVLDIELDAAAAVAAGTAGPCAGLYDLAVFAFIIICHNDLLL